MSQQASSGGYERAVGPGWTARILFWAAIAVGSLPEFVLMPMMIDGVRPDIFTLYPAVTVVVAILELILGVVALLIVKASPMTMRLFGMGLLIFISIYAFALPHLLPIIVNRVVSSVDLAMNIQSIIWTFHGGVVLAGMLIAWNLARNRAWWTHLVAAGFAMCTGLVVAFVEWAMNSLGSSFATSMVLTQLVLLGVSFGGLVLLHLLGRVASGPSDRYAEASARSIAEGTTER
ncbi:hypothetical protein [Brevibacterium sp. UCMA 11754]|uniref:hypothetical protein n=1 Tax=Brevibacterium sp. UCMA 11754 TaxID=2749198 RepID=UPI001F3CC0D0|nr:hypothetical protein [Brevibacterium sp. UCMA 11754]MCF2570706.1 hypothetical protein [Brevibacterium sp. UCMA 11754]